MRKVDNETRLKIYNKYNGYCAYCGVKLSYNKMQVDHFLPVRKAHYLETEQMKDAMEVDNSLEDMNQLSNLMPSCARCNRWKSTLQIEQFRNAIKNLIVGLNRDSSQYRMAKDYGLILESGTNVTFYYEKY